MSKNNLGPSRDVPQSGGKRGRPSQSQFSGNTAPSGRGTIKGGPGTPLPATPSKFNLFNFSQNFCSNYDRGNFIRK